MELEYVAAETKLYGQDILEGRLFSEYTRNCLYRHGCRTVGHLARMSVEDLLAINGIYERQCEEIVEELSALGVTIQKRDTNNPPRIHDAARKLPYPENLLYDIWGEAEFMHNRDTFLDSDHIRGLAAALALLSDQDETVLLLRYKHLYTLEEIGSHYHVTSERARQILKKALRKLRHPVYTRIIKNGLNGYIESRIEQEVAKKIDALLYDEYMRGYQHGLEDSTEGLENLQQTKLKLEPIETLNLSVRAFNCLKRAGAQTIGDLLPYDVEEIFRIRNLGRKCIIEVAMKLREKNIQTPAWEKARAESENYFKQFT